MARTIQKRKYLLHNINFEIMKNKGISVYRYRYNLIKPKTVFRRILEYAMYSFMQEVRINGYYYISDKTNDKGFIKVLQISPKRKKKKEICRFKIVNSKADKETIKLFLFDFIKAMGFYVFESNDVIECLSYTQDFYSIDNKVGFLLKENNSCSYVLKANANLIGSWDYLSKTEYLQEVLYKRSGITIYKKNNKLVLTPLLHKVTFKILFNEKIEYNKRNLGFTGEKLHEETINVFLLKQKECDEYNDFLHTEVLQIEKMFK